MPSPFFAQISLGTFATVLTLAVLVGAALIVLFSRRREDVHTTLTANVSALQGLLNTTKEKLAQTEKELEREKVQNERLEQENKATALEYKALAAVDVSELISAGRLKRENEALREEVRELLQASERRRITDEVAERRRLSE
jgi:cell shape-determining protein MreC